MAQRTKRAAWGLVGVLWTVLAVSSAEALPFALEKRSLPHERTRIRVYDTETGRTIWTRTLYEVQVVSWSADRQALAVIGTGTPNSYSFVLLVWRNGERVRRFTGLPPFLRWEVAREAIWSPNKRRLLMLGPYTMGEGSVGLSSLWCFGLPNGRTRFIAHSVTRAQWVSPTRFRYWDQRLIKDKARNLSWLPETPHERHCP